MSSDDGGVRQKSPLEKIIHRLEGLDSILNDETQKVPKSVVAEIVVMVARFKTELEHEKAHAIVQILTNCTNMEGISFQKGRIYQLKKLQRDFDRE